MPSNYSRIFKLILKVIKANLLLDKIRFNIPFNFAIPQSFHFWFRSSILGLSQKQFMRVIMWLETWNTWLFLSFEFRAKLFGQELLDFGQPNWIIIVLVQRTSGWENFSLTLYMYEYILCELLISSYLCNF